VRLGAADSGSPGNLRLLRTSITGAVPVQPPPVRGHEQRSLGSLSDGQVECPCRPRDGDDLAAPAGDRQGPVAALKAQVLDVSATDGEQGYRPGPAPAGELAQVQRVRLAGQAAVSRQKPGEGDPLGIGEDRLDCGKRGYFV
jgi:hypothetical protein